MVTTAGGNCNRFSQIKLVATPCNSRRGSKITTSKAQSHIQYKNEWESSVCSPIILVALTFLALANCLLSPVPPSDLYAFACQVSKAWLIMAGLVIFQSHLFSTFQHCSQSTIALVLLEFFRHFLN
jgi:hypothetical protein